jgi:hypothetical protein
MRNEAFPPFSSGYRDGFVTFGDAAGRRDRRSQICKGDGLAVLRVGYCGCPELLGGWGIRRGGERTGDAIAGFTGGIFRGYAHTGGAWGSGPGDLLRPLGRKPLCFAAAISEIAGKGSDPF